IRSHLAGCDVPVWLSGDGPAFRKRRSACVLMAGNTAVLLSSAAFSNSLLGGSIGILFEQMCGHAAQWGQLPADQAELGLQQAMVVVEVLGRLLFEPLCQSFLR